MTEDQREVSPLSRGVMLPWRLNPYPPDYRPAFACSLILYPLPRRLALRVAFPRAGRTTGLPRSADVPEWVRSPLYAGGAASAPGEFGAPGPDHVPFGPSLTASLACPCSRRLRGFTWVDLSTRSWLPTTLMLAVAVSARALAALPKEEATLSRELRTPPLPATHVPVGYCWQNSRCCRSLQAAAQLHRRPRVAPERNRQE